MADRKQAPRELWIRGTDRNGNEVNPAIVDAAHRIWPRARLIVLRYLGDDSDAPEIVERVAHSASQSTAATREICAVETYLLRSIAREALRRKRRAERLVFVGQGELERFARPDLTDIDRQIDNERSLARFYACMDGPTRLLFDYRRLDFSWKEIARILQYSSAHSAEVQFSKGIRRARQRFERQVSRRRDDTGLESE